MSPDTKDLVQVAAAAVAVVGGLIAAFRAVAEFRRSNDQRREDMRWRQAEMAKRCLDEMRADPLARAALKMLDWSGLRYERPGGGTTGVIDRDTRRAALRTTNTMFADKDDAPFIRDAYDALFDGFERLEHFTRMKLIDFDDVEPAFRYYVEKMSAPDDRAIFVSFLDTYGFALAAAFLERFAPWRLSQPPAPETTP